MMKIDPLALIIGYRYDSIFIIAKTFSFIVVDQSKLFLLHNIYYF